MPVKLWGGLQGTLPPKVGEVEAEFVVEGWPVQERLDSEGLEKLRAKLNRARLDAGLRKQPGWWVDPWTWRLEDRFDRPAASMEVYQRVPSGTTFAGTYRTIGRVWLTWPLPEDLA